MKDKDGKELNIGDEVTIACQGRRRLYVAVLREENLVIGDGKGMTMIMWPDEVRQKGGTRCH